MNDPKTYFKRVDYDLSGLLHYIDIGDIGLPDIQRPFVWKNTKVRDLFDSMYRGFPVGYLLFWENVNPNGTKQIGTKPKRHNLPSRLIIDGQQRLTSLYAVFRGQKVVDKNYRERNIEIAFRPRDGKFDVADAAIRRDPEWIPNISELWIHGVTSWTLINEFIKRVSDKVELEDDQKEQIAHNLDRLFDLQKYPFTALEIASTVNEEQVADIFVRINSEGVKLEQADFILTLLSVFWDEGRADLEQFCFMSSKAPSPGESASPFNHFLQPEPDQLLRVAIALGFKRGRMKSVYQILRGKDSTTGEFLEEKREAQFDILEKAQKHVLNLTHWHQFFSALVGAGFRSNKMISSQNTLLFAYAFYLIGRVECGVREHELQKAIGRWFFTSNLTRRYSSSPETTLDADLNRIKAASGPHEFLDILDNIISNELTGDFWSIGLPDELASSSARNPALFAFIAAQNRLNAPVLFSHKSVSDLLDPAIITKKTALERHHLFPRHWLEQRGITDLKMINQMANYTLLEWPDNIEISDKGPQEYVPDLKRQFNGDSWARMHDLHALPLGWESMEYEEFLVERRRLMADVIRRGFNTLR